MDSCTMFDVRKSCCFRLDVRFWLCIVAFFNTVTWCYGNSCPIFNLPPRAERAPYITSEEVENACQVAEYAIHSNTDRERSLATSGRTVNLTRKSADSVHPQSSAPPVIRQMEQRQELLHQVAVALQQRSKLTPIQAACGLPNFDLTVSCLEKADGQCTSNQTTIYCDSYSKYRTADGSCNNLDNPTWGSSFSCFRRLLAPDYSADDGLRKSSCPPCGELPLARTISLYVHSNLDKKSYDYTHMHMFFGQLLDHDITSTAQSLTVNNRPIQCCPPLWRNHPQCAPIIIPYDDPFYRSHRVSCMNFVRSAICPTCTLGTRTQINQVTATIDASFVYGSTAEQTNSLRSFFGGELLSQNGSMGRELLPASTQPRNDSCSVPEKNQICFRAGDKRVNENAMLVSLQTIFLREHNRIARILRNLNPRWNDERTFQEARQIVGAIMQAIVYQEYLPTVLGNEFMIRYDMAVTGRKTYFNSCNPSLATEFSIAFRYAHTMISSVWAEIPKKRGHTGHLLRNFYLEPFGICNGEMDPLVRGATRSSAQSFDRHLVEDVTNFLYRTRNETVGLDLASYNIQRGRDHGVTGYIKYARLCGLDVYTFDDLVIRHVMTQDTVDILRKYYACVDDIDLFTGIIAEKHIHGTDYNVRGPLVGPTGRCILGWQFYNLQKCDRFYFENVGLPNSFTQEQIAELRQISLARLICDNTDISRIQSEVMKFEGPSNPIQDCWLLPRMSLSAWAETPEAT